MKRKLRVIPLLIAAVLTLGSFVGCAPSDKTGGAAAQTETAAKDDTSKTDATKDAAKEETKEAAPANAAPDTSKEVNLVYYLWGSEGPANKDILAQINAKLKTDINATVEIKYIDWPDIATKYPLLFASGEKFDLSHASPSAPVSVYTLASQDALTDITGMLDTVAPTLKQEIPEQTWADAKFDGKIIAIPCLYSEFTPIAFVYRQDLKDKFGVPDVTDIATMEQFLDKAKASESFSPMNGNSYLAIDLYRFFTQNTGKWITAPGINDNENYLVSTGTDYKEIIHPAFTQEFEDWAVKMKEWSDKEYWPKDVLSAQTNAKDNTLNGLSSAFLTSMPDWTGSYGNLQQKLPGKSFGAWHPAETNGKIQKKAGVENATVISVNSENPERALMAIEKFMTEEAYYRLIQNGIEGKQYVLEGGKLAQPASFVPEKDGGGFAVWSLRNDKFNIPLTTEDDRRYTLIEEWKKVAVPNPYMGFTFKPDKVATELASITNVNAQIGTQILLGKATTDPKAAVQQYRDELKQAGLDKVIEEVKAQLANFTPVQ